MFHLFLTRETWLRQAFERDSGRDADDVLVKKLFVFLSRTYRGIPKHIISEVIKNALLPQNVFVIYDKCCWTSLLTRVPSALPFTLGMMAPITLPMSCLPDAPSLLMAS